MQYFIDTRSNGRKIDQSQYFKNIFAIFLGMQFFFEL